MRSTSTTTQALLAGALQKDSLTILDLYVWQLADGSTFYWTSFDADVVTNGNTFSSMGPKIGRTAITWKRGTEVSPLELSVFDSNTIIDQNLTISQALVAGLFNGATVTLYRAYNPVRQPDGTFSVNWADVIPLFQGWVGEVKAGRTAAAFTINSLFERINIPWPYVQTLPACRWNLFDPGCTLTRSVFTVNGTVNSPAIDRLNFYHNLTQVTGYFDQGRVTFTSGQNKGLSRMVRSGLGTASSYSQAVLNDKPIAYYHLGANANDSSGNGYNGTATAVTFGQRGVLTGDPSQSALFNGTTSKITLPIPKPGSSARGISFEFWFKLTPSPSSQQPVGIFDTFTTSKGLQALRNQNPLSQVGPAFSWGAKGKVTNAFTQPAPGIWTHVAVCFHGSQIIDLYLNGQLVGSVFDSGSGGIDWTNPILCGKINYAGNLAYYAGYLQEFAVYNYTLSPDQPLAHFTAGTTPPTTAANGLLTVNRPLPFVPQPGDLFTATPGCDKAQRTCDLKFSNLPNFGGFPFMPAPETAM